MAYDVTGLPAYVEQQKFPLLRKAVAGAKSASLLTKQTGIKGQQTLNIFDDSIVLQTQGCGFNAEGTTTLTQRTIVVGRIKIDKNWCDEQLNGFYIQTQLNPGSDNETVPFWQQLVGLFVDQVAEVNEIQIWQGDTASGNTNPNTNKFDGFIKLIDADGTTVPGNTAAVTSLTAGNIIAVVNAIFEAIPASILTKPDTKIVMGLDTFRLYQMALVSANLYNYFKAGVGSDYEVIVPGTNISVVGLHGLDGTSRIYATNLSNLYLGLDLSDEEDKLDVWYSKDYQEIRANCKYKMGVQYAFGPQIVNFKLAA